jgi:hypothetical protein
MRHWKKILIVVAIVLIVAIAGVVLSIDGIAQRAVERQSSAALGVETSLRTLTLGILRGQVKLTGLKVKNPKGYTSDHFLTMDTGGLEVTLGSLLKDTVVVPTLELDNIDLILEKKDGNANYSEIQTNLAGQDSQDKNTQPGKKFIINDLLIKNVTVHADVSPFGGEATRVTLNIPEIHLKNVGSDSDKGVVMIELTNVVVKAIFEAILKANSPYLPAEITAGLNLGMSHLKGVGKVDITTVEGVTSVINQAAGGSASGSGGDTTQDIGNTAKGALDSIGGMFDSKTKKKSKKKDDDDN